MEIHPNVSDFGQWMKELRHSEITSWLALKRTAGHVKMLLLLRLKLTSSATSNLTCVTSRMKESE